MGPRFFVNGTCPTFAESYKRLVPRCSEKDPKIEISEDDDAAIYFSSGTTGFPKAILHDHRSIMSAAETEQAHHGQARGDNFMCIAPLYHTGGKMHWFGSLLSGSKGVLLRGTKPEWILGAVSDEAVTIVWLLVPWAQDILEALDRGDLKLEDYKLAQWRLMHIGAQPVPPSLVHRWLQYFPDHAVRHRLRPHRVGRPGLRAPRARERPQGGRHRHRRLRLAGRDRAVTAWRRSPRVRWASSRSRAPAS